MDNRVLRKTLIALLIIFTVLLSFFYLPDLILKSPPQVYRIDRWYCTDYSQNGKAVQLNLPDILPQNQANGESMLYTALSENFLEGQSICFGSYYRSVEVYLEDDLIYYFDDTNEGSFGKAASSKWNFVQINASNRQNRNRA